MRSRQRAGQRAGRRAGQGTGWRACADAWVRVAEGYRSRGCLIAWATVHGDSPPLPQERSNYERLGHDESALFSRRSFLRTSALALAGATMYACTGGGRKQPVVAPVATTSVVATDTQWPIKRAIYVMMENRSFDNLYGRFPGANGATVGVKFGQEVPLTSSPHWLPGDIPHDRAAHLNDVNGGAYDGFGNGQFGGPWAYTQLGGTWIGSYWCWAGVYWLVYTLMASVG